MEVYIIAFVVGVVVTGVISYLLHRSSLSSTIAVSEEKMTQHAAAVQQYMQEKKDLEVKTEGLVQRANKAESQNELLRQHSDSYVQLQEHHQSVLTQVANLTAQLKYN